MSKVRQWKLYVHGSVFWLVAFLDKPLPGRKTRRVRISTDTRVEAGEAAARIQAKRIMDELDAGAPVVSAGGALTVRAYGETWIRDRHERGKLAWKDEQAHLRDHLYPVLGARPIAEITKAEMIEWARGLASHGRCDGKPGNIGGRTCINVAYTIRHLFKDAAKLDIVKISPCAWDASDLPRKGADKDRLEAGFSEDNIGLIFYDDRIPEDRRVLYAMEFLTGMRMGEAAMRRWEDWKPAEKPLGMIVARTAWSTRHHLEKPTKTWLTRWLPVHRALEELLHAWMREGFERVFGRPPTPEDLIVPSLGGGGRKWESGQPRNNSYSWRMFQRDLSAVGLRAQQHYESRSTFRSLALAGGADLHAVDLITHPSPKDAKDLYERRRLLWPKLCEAVSCISVRRPRKGLSLVEGGTPE